MKTIEQQIIEKQDELIEHHRRFHKGDFYDMDLWRGTYLENKIADLKAQLKERDEREELVLHKLSKELYLANKRIENYVRINALRKKWWQFWK